MWPHASLPTRHPTPSTSGPQRDTRRTVGWITGNLRAPTMKSDLALLITVIVGPRCRLTAAPRTHIIVNRVTTHLLMSADGNHSESEPASRTGKVSSYITVTRAIERVLFCIRRTFAQGP